MPAAVAATRAGLESAGIHLTEGIARLEGGISTNAVAAGKLYTPS